MPMEQPKPNAEAIVEMAFGYFDKFVDRGKKLDGVLLEELEPQDDGWVVSIGFNGTRKETSEPAHAGSMAVLAGYGQKTTTTVREVRHIFLDFEGEFQRIS